MSPVDEERTLRRLWSLREEVALESDDERLVMIAPWGEIDLGAGATRVEPDLRRLALGPVDLENAEPGRRVELGEILDGVTGAVAHSLEQAGLGRARLSVVPIAAEAPFTPAPADPRDVVRLSRLAVIRPWAGSLVVSAPGARHEVVCEGPVLGALLSRIAASIRVADLSGRAIEGGADGDPCLAGATCQDVEDVLGWLITAGVVQVSRVDGTYDEDVDPSLAGWSPHELEFDARTRRPGQAAAERVRFLDGVRAREVARGSDPTPTVPLPTVPLPGADPGDAWTDDILGPAAGPQPFSGIALTTARLGDLLSRGLRGRLRRARSEPWTGTAARPDPGGSCAFEVYVALNRAELDVDVYRYDPEAHAVSPLGLAATAVVDIVAAGVAEAGAGAGAFTPAAVLLTTSRHTGGSGGPGTASHATALSRAGALQEVLHLAGRRSRVAVHPASLEATEGWQILLDRVWPAEVPVAVCLIDPGE